MWQPPGPWRTWSKETARGSTAKSRGSWPRTRPSGGWSRRRRLPGAGSPYGLVGGFGPEEPAGWQQLWRQRLQAQEATAFEWHGAGREHPEEDVRAVAAATTVWLAFDGQAPPLEAETVLRANRGFWLDARLPQSADGKLVAEQGLQMHPDAEPPLLSPVEVIGPRAGAGGAGPSALAAGAQERRRLKQGAKQPGPTTDLDSHMFTNVGTPISTNLGRPHSQRRGGGGSCRSRRV